MAENIQNAIYAAIEEINLQRLPDQQLEASTDTVLAGDGGLDSLGLVNFVVLLEEKLASATGREVSLISDGMDFQSGGVFASVSTLCDHIATLVDG